MGRAGTNGRLGGLIPAIFTPMDERGAIDHGLLEKQAAYLAEAGVDGFFVGGTACEGASLSTAEKREVFRTVRRVSAGRQFLAAACIRPSTAAVLEEITELGREEPDFVVAVTPYYLAIRPSDFVQFSRKDQSIIWGDPRLRRLDHGGEGGRGAGRPGQPLEAPEEPQRHR